MDTTNIKTCKNFVANLWRPNTCTNCYRSKSLHRRNIDQHQPSSISCRKVIGSRNNKLSALGTSNSKGDNSGKAHLSQVSSIRALEGHKISRTGEWGSPTPGDGLLDVAPKLRPLVTGPMIGIVRPYAIVDIDNESTQDDSLDTLKESGRFLKQAASSF